MPTITETSSRPQPHAGAVERRRDREPGVRAAEALTPTEVRGAENVFDTPAKRLRFLAFVLLIAGVTVIAMIAVYALIA